MNDDQANFMNFTFYCLRDVHATIMRGESSDRNLAVDSGTQKARPLPSTPIGFVTNRTKGRCEASLHE